MFGWMRTLARRLNAPPPSKGGTVRARVRDVPVGFRRVVPREPGDARGRIGDPVFDAHVRIGGDDPCRMLAALGPDDRTLLRRAVREGWRLGDDGWTLHRETMEAGDIDRAVQRARVLSEHARRPPPRGSGLGARLSDPDSGVRSTAVGLLIRTPAHAGEWHRLQFSNDPLVLLAISVALRDRDTLRWLGQQGEPELAFDAWLALLALEGATVSVAWFEPVMGRVLDASRRAADMPRTASRSADLRLHRIMLALARWGSPAAFVHLLTRPETLPTRVRALVPATVAAIRKRHASERGTLSLVDAVGPQGRLSLVDPRRREPVPPERPEGT